jgi:hypothetical protein
MLITKTRLLSIIHEDFLNFHGQNSDPISKLAPILHKSIKLEHPIRITIFI